MLPAKAAGSAREWPTVRKICRVKRWRWQKVNGKSQESQEETVYPIARLTAAVSPQALAPRQSQSLGHRDHAQEQGRHPRPRTATRTAGTTRPAIFSPSQASCAKSKKVGITLANQSHRTLSRRQKPSYPSLLRFSLNRPATLNSRVHSRGVLYLIRATIGRGNFARRPRSIYTA